MLHRFICIIALCSMSSEGNLFLLPLSFPIYLFMEDWFWIMATLIIYFLLNIQCSLLSWQISYSGGNLNVISLINLYFLLLSSHWFLGWSISTFIKLKLLFISQLWPSKLKYFKNINYRCVHMHVLEPYFISHVLEQNSCLVLWARNIYSTCFSALIDCRTQYEQFLPETDVLQYGLTRVASIVC